MPVTRTFVLGNADHARIVAFKPNIHEKPRDAFKMTEQEREDAYRKNPASVTSADDAFYEIMEEARKQGYVTAMWYAFGRTTLPGVVTVNNGGPYAAGNINAADIKHLVYAERMGSRIAVDFVEIARTWRIPGLEECTLLRLGPALGARQTRNIVGDYAITPEDLQSVCEVEDAIALNFETRIDTVYYHAAAKPGNGISYRSLIPKGIDGLLVAGRCMSLTSEAAGGCRAQGTVMQVGEAAGVAAARASAQRCGVREVDIKAVQQALIEMGAPVYRSQYEGV
jgi:hypothetical protein